MQCGFCTPGLIVASARPAAPATRSPTDAEIREALAGNLCRCTGYEKILDAVRLAAGAERAMSAVVIEGCAIATVDAAGTEHADGHVVIDGDRIAAVGAGPRRPTRRRRRDGASTARGCLATPGLVNCHHHLYQWATRGLAQQATLFEWLDALYPVWARHRRRDRVRAAARAGLAALALLGLHDLDRPPLRLPARRAATCSSVEIEAAARARPALPPVPRLDGPRARPTAACRPTRSSRTATRSSPPARRRSTASTTRRPDAMLRIALAPCSPFSRHRAS